MLLVYKPPGETPYQIVQKIQSLPQYHDAKIGYAGRLDPMAEGLLLLLVDEENKKRKTYERLKKRYVFTMLCGIATDSYDLLGLITQSKRIANFKQVQKKIAAELPRFVGKHIQQYPPYSSRRVDGKPLFYWAREGKIDTVTLPSKKIEIHTLSLSHMNVVAATKLKNYILTSIENVQGDFRQKLIHAGWENYFAQHQDSTNHLLVACAISCSSGTYVRQLVHDIGSHIQLPLTAYAITRTNIGKYSLKDLVRKGEKLDMIDLFKDKQPLGRLKNRRNSKRTR
ncbi:hypothetical protein KC726_01215 [Candidatus Woesebacteria bacterium]|nr:hypothetical protein [Candidatus Woesebacteria bacterium]